MCVPCIYVWVIVDLWWWRHIILLRSVIIESLFLNFETGDRHSWNYGLYVDRVELIGEIRLLACSLIGRYRWSALAWHRSTNVVGIWEILLRQPFSAAHAPAAHATHASSVPCQCHPCPILPLLPMLPHATCCCCCCCADEDTRRRMSDRWNQTSRCV